MADDKISDHERRWRKRQAEYARVVEMDDQDEVVIRPGPDMRLSEIRAAIFLWGER